MLLSPKKAQASSGGIEDPEDPEDDYDDYDDYDEYYLINKKTPE